MSQFTEWKVLAKMVTESLAGEALKQCISKMSDEGDALRKVVPTWADMTEAPKLNLTLLNKHLVRWPSKKAMNEGAIRLEKAQTHVAKVFALWGLEGTVEADARYEDKMTTVTTAFQAASRAILLTAIINRLQNVPASAARNAELRGLKVQAELWLPKSVKDAIDKIR